MKFFSRLDISVLAATLISNTAAAGSYQPAPSYLLKINGQVFRQHNAGIRRAPVSLTKIMTALVVMERCDLDEVVVVSRGAARETGSRVGLRRGEKFKVRDLLAATLIASVNDACRALADRACGNQTDFVVQMNAQARALDLEDTHFTNACGHDNKGLYSNAHDLARLEGDAGTAIRKAGVDTQHAHHHRRRQTQLPLEE